MFCGHLSRISLTMAGAGPYIASDVTTTPELLLSNYLESSKTATAPARVGKMGMSSPIAIVAGASQRKAGEREIGLKRTIKWEISRLEPLYIYIIDRYIYYVAMVTASSEYTIQHGI